MLIDFGLSEEVVPFKKPKSFAKVAAFGTSRSDKKQLRDRSLHAESSSSRLT